MKYLLIILIITTSNIADNTVELTPELVYSFELSGVCKIFQEQVRKAYTDSDINFVHTFWVNMSSRFNTDWDGFVTQCKTLHEANQDLNNILTNQELQSETKRKIK